MNLNRFFKYTLGLATASLLFASYTFASADVKHKVKKGETIYGIAYQYNISPEELLKANPQANNGVLKDMILTIPDSNGSAPAASKPSPSIALKESKSGSGNANAEADTPLSSTYTVKKGDTFYSISHKTGVSIDRLIELNPFDDPSRLSIGKKIRLTDNVDFVSEDYAIDDADDGNDEDIDYVAVVDEPQKVDIPKDKAVEEEVGIDPIVYDDVEIADETGNIMLILPFMAESEIGGKMAQKYQDFYRGFLLAANELNTKGKNLVKIIAYDSASGTSPNKDEMLQKAVNENVKVIITPEDDDNMRSIIEYANANDMYIMNLFNFKDDAYLTYPYVIQGNIMPEMMYQKAIDYILSFYYDYIPVIIDPKEGKDEKMAFITELLKSYSDKGVEPITLSFDDELTNEDLDFIQPDLKYIFIPKSGSVSEFNKYISQVLDLKVKDLNPDRFLVFGYPDWTGFRGTALDNLHKANAVVYSRFNLNYNDDDSKKIENDFRNWYGINMMEAVPSPAILGYDTGMYLIKAMQNDGIGNALRNEKYNGVQSTFQFARPSENAGYSNNALYIITFGYDDDYFVKVL